MTIRSLVVGSCISLLGIGTVAAADLPMSKAEAVEYVKVAGRTSGVLLHTGQRYLPRIYRPESRADYFYSQPPNNATNNRNLDQTIFRTNTRVRFDARTQTDYGFRWTLLL